MYPQQHQQHHVPVTNLQQPYYSANPYLIPYPHTSDSAIHPPGTDPPGNSTSLSVPDAQTTVSQYWLVQQAEPIRYDLASGSSHVTPVASASLPYAWNGAWSHQVFTNDATIMLPHKTKVTKAMRCEVCKIDCNTADVYEKHILGKKHKKNLQLQNNPTTTVLSGPSHANVQSSTSGIQGQVPVGAEGEELESKKRKDLSGGTPMDSVKICTVCNVMCNSEVTYSKHLAGRRHMAQVGLMNNNGIGPSVAAFKRRKAPKKIQVAQSAWCEVCKITCDTKDMYIIHLSGKKHLKNLEKLSKPDTDVGASAAPANPIIGPLEKPGSDKPRKAPEMDIETKKRKIVEGGAAEAAVRLCDLCNVVCNSEKVFNTHLVGHKHAAMVKKKQAESSTS